MSKNTGCIKYHRNCIICGEPHSFTNEFDHHETLYTTLQNSVCTKCREAIMVLRQAIKEGKI